MLPWPAHIAPLTLTECSRELAVDVVGQPAIRPARRVLVRRTHNVDECLDQRGLVRTEELVTREWRGGRLGVCCARDARGHGDRGSQSSGTQYARTDRRCAGEGCHLSQEPAPVVVRSVCVSHRSSFWTWQVARRGPLKS